MALSRARCEYDERAPLTRAEVNRPCAPVSSSGGSIRRTLIGRPSSVVYFTIFVSVHGIQVIVDYKFGDCAPQTLARCFIRAEMHTGLHSATPRFFVGPRSGTQE